MIVSFVVANSNKCLAGRTFNDVWQYNPSTQLWVWVSGNDTVNEQPSYGTQGVPSPSSNPGSRQGFGSASDNTTFWLFGGIGSVSGQLSDLWNYNLTTNEWTWVSGNGTTNQFGEFGSLGVPSDITRPGSRRSSQAWIDLNGSFWLFGGYGYANRTSKSSLYFTLTTLCLIFIRHGLYE